MGFAAVFAQIGRFVDVLRRFGRYLDEQRPDLVVLLDYPGLHLRMAALARRRQIPVVYYVCPQLWAWAPWRARRFTRVVDHALTILPFEEEYFRRRGITARFVGHPSADVPARGTPAPDTDLLHRLKATALPLALMPGSRPQEVRENLPPMLGAARRIRERLPQARFFLPQRRADTAAACRALLAAEAAAHGKVGEFIEVVEAVEPVLQHVRFALVASGTATFEVALHRVPMVVYYRIRWQHELLGRLMLTVPWISLVNLIAGRALVPEFVTADTSPRTLDAIAAASVALIGDTPERRACLDALAGELAPAFAPGASRRAAEEIAGVLARISAE
jgi:lipid-A-disaccharide synthase